MDRDRDVDDLLAGGERQGRRRQRVVVAVGVGGVVVVRRGVDRDRGAGGAVERDREVERPGVAVVALDDRWRGDVDLATGRRRDVIVVDGAEPVRREELQRGAARVGQLDVHRFRFELVAGVAMDRDRDVDDLLAGGERQGRRRQRVVVAVGVGGVVVVRRGVDRDRGAGGAVERDREVERPGVAVVALDDRWRGDVDLATGRRRDVIVVDGAEPVRREELQRGAARVATAGRTSFPIRTRRGCRHGP